MLKLLGIAFILLAAAVMLRGFGWRGAPIFAVIASLLLIKEAVSGIAEIFRASFFSELYSGLEAPVLAALKILGLGYLFGVSCDICRELGENGIAKALEIVGRVEIIVVIIPFFEEIIRVGTELIK